MTSAAGLSEAWAAGAGGGCWLELHLVTFAPCVSMLLPRVPPLAPLVAPLSVAVAYYSYCRSLCPPRSKVQGFPGESEQLRCTPPASARLPWESHAALPTDPRDVLGTSRPFA